MGTLFRITLFAPAPEQARAAAEEAFDRIDTLDDILSDYQADSELSLLREHPPGTPVPVSVELFSVLEKSGEITRLTQGAFDVTAGPYSRLWRFSRKRKELPPAKDLAEARNAVGMDKLRLDSKHRTVVMTQPGMRLDAGGIAKGYAADEALKALRARGFGRALVAASGDIAVGDPPPGKRGWTIEVAAMGSEGPKLLRLFLNNAAVSTSGDTEQHIILGGTRFSHILDPSTGLGLTNRIQATVVAPNGMLSDPLATSLCILGPRRGLKLIESIRGAAALIIEETEGFERATRSRRLGRYLVPE